MPNRRRNAIVGTVLLATWIFAAQVSSLAQTAPTLSPTTKRVVFDRTAFFGPSTPLPSWDNGYLVAREVETFQEGMPNVRLYDSSGNKVREASVWFPAAQRVLIYSAAATRDGRILASGTVEKSDGSAASFIAVTDLTGRVTNVIQTTGFAPTSVCEAPDGSIWAFGSTGYGLDSQANPGDMLRHFDFEKGQIGSYLPRSAFPQNLHPGPGVNTDIRCLADQVVVYSRNARAYIEMKFGTDVPKIYDVAAPPGFRFVEIALAAPHKAYAYFSLKSKGGLYYLAFDPAGKSATWQPIESTIGPWTQPGAIVGLWGSDGKDLLVSRAEDTAGSQAIYWATPIEH